jgi:hypothetical protein
MTQASTFLTTKLMVQLIDCGRDVSIHSYDVHNFIKLTFECMIEYSKNKPTGDDVIKCLPSGLDNWMLQVAIIKNGAS